MNGSSRTGRIGNDRYHRSRDSASFHRPAKKTSDRQVIDVPNGRGSPRDSYKTLKLYGERHTGTNYLSRLIAVNLDVELLVGTVPASVNLKLKNRPGAEIVRDLYFAVTARQNLGWKHRLVDPAVLQRKAGEAPGQIAFVALAKNPYSWLLSLHRKPYHLYTRDVPALAEFIRRPLRSVARESAPGGFKSPMDLWNRKNLAYLELADAVPTVLLRYEDLLDSPSSAIEQIGERFGLPRVREGFANFEASTKDSTRSYDDYRRYYLEERWRAELPGDCLEIINSAIDQNLMGRLDYRVIQPGSLAS